LGETKAAQSLVAGLLAQGETVLLTHTTATGRMEGARLFALDIAAGRLRQQWLPYDFPGATRRFLRHYQPRLGILVEREVWPCLVSAATILRVPLVLASARMSERSLRQNRRLDRVFGGLIQDSYRQLDLVLAQSQDDADRLFDLGARHIKVVGNLKFDLSLPVVPVESGHAWRKRLDRPVVAIASTREGEDAMFVPAIVSVVRAATPTPAPLFLLIPRHPQRFEEAAALLIASGLKFARWSALRHDPQADSVLAGLEVVLGDTIGEMPFFYAASDVAIVAGSFAPLGGQNFIEACAVGTPAIVGPFVRNFADAVESALAAEAVFQVQGKDGNQAARESMETALQWIENKAAREQKSLAARSWVSSHAGATRTMLQEISELEAGRATREPRLC
jgi:3-deoxy-D-manno-octulosonic-acid transferase